MIIELIKQHQLQARKTRNTQVASLLTTLLGEADTIAKNKGQQLLDDASVFALVQKFINNINLVAEKAGETALTTLERKVLEQYLPSKLSDEALENEIKVITDSLRETIPQNKLMGEVLKALKAKYAGQYDGAKASALVKSMI